MSMVVELPVDCNITAKFAFSFALVVGKYGKQRISYN
jgi:hypothetical protein